MEKIYQLLRGSSGDSSAVSAEMDPALGTLFSRSGILVIAGLLGGVLQVDSILVDREQTVQIVLSGSLKRKSEIDKMLDGMGSMSFDEAMRAIIGHFV
jgi:hypothetical protein